VQQLAAETVLTVALVAVIVVLKDFIQRSMAITKPDIRAIMPFLDTMDIIFKEYI
jgi:hypothetical protein